MAEKSSAASYIEFGKHLFDTLWQWEDSGTWIKWLLIWVVCIVALAVAVSHLLAAISKAIDGFAKLAEIYRSSGLPLPLSGKDRVEVRRRSQFCAVLESDLAQIAKSESWNDQYFTDLEAEVESEGGYYASTFHRLVRRRSHGLRKEASLIDAITKSTERAVQLTGEPGAGKSVALRHLAAQLAVKGKKSKSKRCLVPLYVNLREMENVDPASVTADAIRDFIVDNIRRGDSDTSDFVRSNWNDYRERGIWFFLFDSFDEIPAVLHAEKGSAATTAFSTAIRQFLEGMGTCKGVLASREFKGPEALPWKKFRILSLNLHKQKELVRNAFLSSEDEKVVLHTLAEGGQLSTTPLFLTLLCRYVKEEHQAPKSDYDLLSRHIDRLASKELDYLKRKYNLSPAQVLDGAQKLARLFAEQPALGLAPTLHQVADVAALPQAQIDNVAKLMAALVDCKIGRTDVPNAAQGDRRFAFSHRRYQETLFVRYLVAHPNHINHVDLLTDPRWREYTVTLLQTQRMQSIEPLLDTAATLLVRASATQRRNVALDPIPSSCGYYSWEGEQSTFLLELLQEGLGRRTEEVPKALQRAVEALLRPRWAGGDTTDRREVVRLGALLPPGILAKIIAITFRSGTRAAEAFAFQQAAVPKGVASTGIQEAVLKRLSNETLAAADSSALLRLEALAARLPSSTNALLVYRRSVRLRAVFRALSMFTRFIVPVGTLDRLIERAGKYLKIRRSRGLSGNVERHVADLVFIGLSVLYLWAIVITTSVVTYLKNKSGPDAKSFDVKVKSLSDIADWWESSSTFAKMPTLLLTATLLAFIWIVTLYLLRSRGERLNASFFFRMPRIQNMRKALRFIGWLVAAVVLGGISFHTLGTGEKWLFANVGVDIEIPAILLGGASLVGLVYVFASIFLSLHFISRKRLLDNVSKALKTRPGLEVLLSLRQPRFLTACLTNCPQLLRTTAEHRSFSALLTQLLSGKRFGNCPPLISQIARSEILKALQELEDQGRASAM